MKKIVKGNDFTMRVIVNKIVDGEQQPFSLPACEEVKALAVGRYRRYELQARVDAKDDSVLLVRVEGDKLPLGKYALEVKGKLFGNDWRSNEYCQFALVDSNAEADTEFRRDLVEGEDSVEMDTAIVFLPPEAGLAELADKFKVETLKDVRAETDRLHREFQSVTDAEAERVSNEKVRIASEGNRIENEDTRISNEEARIDSETVRIRDEKARIVAEDERASAEVERISEEGERIANETNRSKNERNRVTAEKERSTAFSSMQENISSKIEEANNATSDLKSIKDAAVSAANDATTATTQANEAAQQARVAAENVKDGESGIPRQAMHGTGDTTFSLRPNIMEVWGVVPELSLSLAQAIDAEFVTEYLFEFTCPTDKGTSLNLPAELKWYNEYVVVPEAGKTYQASIVNHVIVMGRA